MRRRISWKSTNPNAPAWRPAALRLATWSAAFWCLLSLVGFAAFLNARPADGLPRLFVLLNRREELEVLLLAGGAFLASGLVGALCSIPALVLLSSGGASSDGRLRSFSEKGRWRTGALKGLVAFVLVATHLAALGFNLGVVPWRFRGSDGDGLLFRFARNAFYGLYSAEGSSDAADWNLRLPQASATDRILRVRLPRWLLSDPTLLPETRARLTQSRPYLSSAADESATALAAAQKMDSRTWPADAPGAPVRVRQWARLQVLFSQPQLALALHWNLPAMFDAAFHWNFPAPFNTALDRARLFPEDARRLPPLAEGWAARFGKQGRGPHFTLTLEELVQASSERAEAPLSPLPDAARLRPAELKQMATRLDRLLARTADLLAQHERLAIWVIPAGSALPEDPQASVLFRSQGVARERELPDGWLHAGILDAVADAEGGGPAGCRAIVFEPTRAALEEVVPMSYVLGPQRTLVPNPEIESLRFHRRRYGAACRSQDGSETLMLWTASSSTQALSTPTRPGYLSGLPALLFRGPTPIAPTPNHASTKAATNAAVPQSPQRFDDQALRAQLTVYRLDPSGTLNPLTGQTREQVLASSMEDVARSLRKLATAALESFDVR